MKFILLSIAGTAFVALLVAGVIRIIREIFKKD